jgi:signal transduction histidine kinase
MAKREETLTSPGARPANGARYPVRVRQPGLRKPLHLQEALLNLIRNAADAIGDASGGEEVKIRDY